MKIQEFRKLIREEAVRVLNESNGSLRTLQQFVEYYDRPAALKVIPKYLGDANNIVTISKIDNRELFEILNQYYEQPQFKNSFKPAPKAIDSDNKEGNREGNWYYSKPANLFYYDRGFSDPVYVMAKDTLKNAGVGSINRIKDVFKKYAR